MDKQCDFRHRVFIRLHLNGVQLRDHLKLIKILHFIDSTNKFEIRMTSFGLNKKMRLG